MNRLPRLLLLLTLLTLTSMPASTAAAGPGLCFGREATIRGTGYVVGTPGPDVIVTSGAAEVHALGGNDRVCGAFLVYAGPGSDRVRYSRAAGDFPELVGGRGDDLLLLGGGRLGHLRGAPGDDALRSGAGEQFLHGGRGHDVADGGGGDDTCSAEVERRC